MKQHHRDDTTIDKASKGLCLEDFFPSKHRDVLQNALFGAAQNQPSGRALPSLILGEWSTPAEHLKAAKLVNPTADLINAALDQRSKLIILNCAQKPDRVVEKRRAALDAFNRIASGLGPYRDRWTHAIPETSPAKNFHFPLIYFLAHHLQYDDAKIVFDLSNGMPIAGPVAATPGLTSRKRQAQLSYQQWKREIPKRNLQAIERLSNSQGTELSLKCWEKTLTEVREGWITEPVDLTEFDRKNVPLTPRYAINEQHGLQKPKIRLIDDFRASGINAIVETEDTNVPDNLDAGVAIASYFKLVSPECQLMCATLDFRIGRSQHRGILRVGSGLYNFLLTKIKIPLAMF